MLAHIAAGSLVEVIDALIHLLMLVGVGVGARADGRLVHALAAHPQKKKVVQANCRSDFIRSGIQSSYSRRLETRPTESGSAPYNALYAPCAKAYTCSP